MKKLRQLTALILALAILGMMAALPVSAAQRSRTTFKGSQFPTVLVHGMMGWGGYENVSKTIDYFGAASGSVIRDLKNQGYHDMYEASVGPLSSGWDRACELYAELTGTRVDYGVAHSAKYGHARYGRDYSSNPLIPGFNWNSRNKVNLVGHSFGATTIRLMHDMLADGRQEEVQACRKDGTQVSPLFTGGKRDYVYSITTISGTNNGTDYRDVMTTLNDESVKVYSMWSYALSLLGLPEGFHDFQLDQFGISSSNRASAEQILEGTSFLKHNDAGIKDFEIDRAMKLNQELQVQPNTFYFCYASDASKKNSDGTYGPIDKTFVVLKDYVRRMGRYTGKTSGTYTDGYGSYQTTVRTTPTTLNEEYWPNDGFVNVIGEQTPFRYVNGRRSYDPHQTYQDGMTLKPGTWYVMPKYIGDHFGSIGGFFTENSTTFHQFYRDMFQRIYSCTLTV